MSHIEADPGTGTEAQSTSPAKGPGVAAPAPSLAKVLTLCEFYLPGYRCGGVLRSIANLVEALGDEIDFRILTRDHDDVVATPYTCAHRGGWQRQGKARVLYLTRRELRLFSVAIMLRATPHDVLHLNSVFSRPFSLLPLFLRLARLVPRRPVLIAPNGELSEEALSVKPRRKRLLLAVARALRLHSGATWRVSSESEREDVRRRIGAGARVVVNPNLLPSGSGRWRRSRAAKQAGQLNLVYLSRITRLKNLEEILAALPSLRGKVRLDIYGPCDEPGYWTRCAARIRCLPPNVCASYHGDVDHERVSGLLGHYDMFVLPTRSESFCYAIGEALDAGCPVLVSDRTPWRDLEASRAGVDLPLGSGELLTKTLQRWVDMEEPEHLSWRRGAQDFVRRLTASGQLEARHRALLIGLASGRS